MTKFGLLNLRYTPVTTVVDGETIVLGPRKSTSRHYTDDDLSLRARWQIHRGTLTRIEEPMAESLIAEHDEVEDTESEEDE